MSATPSETGIDDRRTESILSATRTGLGDDLRSVVYFTPSSFDLLYVRADLYPSDENARERKAQLVRLERVGFAERPVRDSIAHSDDGPDIGPYNFTVRFHDEGFVVRVLGGDAGVLFTTDSMDVGAFREAATAIRGVLDGADA
ncbi:hypothetical protein [Halorubrum sp. Atlit-26R]|uniref:DUF7522 family protein n=1 Tax=Halorubrum sp. Atlit-26R TaxID=2282128 RepID=UPI000EF1DD30|nr:hypothetical protein [Halorubrum sp. Atlit-26R]RLM64201.1 hypothetical protein DVK07_14760 [Halorubrum sp. Atlit-26R]